MWPTRGLATELPFRHWAVAGVDRNALRPLRYSRTSDNLLVIGSETVIVVLPESTILEKGRLGPGQMIAVNLDEGKLYRDGELKDRISAEQDYGALVKGFQRIDDLPEAAGDALPTWSRGELTKRQIAAGMTLEDVEMILAPMIEDGKEAIGSMGDDTPLAVISDKPRLISQFFRQNFSQVTNPPIDSLRERHVMSLKTRFSNLANILDEKSENADVLVLESPVLTATEWHRLKAVFGPVAAEIDCTYDIAAGLEGLPRSDRRRRGGSHVHSLQQVARTVMCTIQEPRRLKTFPSRHCRHRVWRRVRVLGTWLQRRQDGREQVAASWGVVALQNLSFFFPPRLQERLALDLNKPIS